MVWNTRKTLNGALSASRAWSKKAEDAKLMTVTGKSPRLFYDPVARNERGKIKGIALSGKDGWETNEMRLTEY